MKTVLEIQVYDRPGVLDRIVSLIRRRGWNIHSLTAGDVGGGTTQITILLQGRDLDVATLGEHLGEMDAVRHWQELPQEAETLREMLLFCAPVAERAQAEADGARILGEADGWITCEMTDSPSRIDAHAQALRQRQIHCVRSGPIMLVHTQGGDDNA